jgi:Arc/MetJ family transcription regulator
LNLSVGGMWLLSITVTDGYGVPADITPTVTLVPPSGVDVDVPVTEVAGGWVAEYLTLAPGVHLAMVDASAFGMAGVSANVLALAAAADRPDRAALDAYLGEHSATDGELDDALAAETQAQWDVCRVPAAYPASLRQALLRRCARNLALRGLPLAVLRGDGESGDTVLPGNDPEVRRFERPWRRLKVG